MYSITIVGAGNVASQLGFSLRNAGHTISQVYSRTKASAQFLAKKLECSYTTDINSLVESDFALIAVKDDAIEEIEKHIDFNKIHTSGSKHLDCLSGTNKGVLYPVQSLSKEKNTTFSKIPICIEANNAQFFNKIKSLADSISTKVQFMNSEQRAYLHLSAVLACNFSSLMYVLSEEICQQHSVSFDLLKPLIEETAKKIKHIPPAQALTGPAKRGDSSVLSQHLSLLLTDSEKREIYQLLSRTIAKRSS